MSENRLSCLFHFRVLEDRVPVGRENPFFFVATTPVGRNLSLRAFIGSEATPPLGNMMLPAGASGSSSSNPRWNLDLNLHPREEVEVPAEEAPQLDMDVYGEKDQDRIKEILDFQLRDKISKKENEIRRVLEGLIEGVSKGNYLARISISATWTSLRGRSSASMRQTLLRMIHFKRNINLFPGC